MEKQVLANMHWLRQSMQPRWHSLAVAPMLLCLWLRWSLFQNTLNPAALQVAQNQNHHKRNWSRLSSLLMSEAQNVTGWCRHQIRSLWWRTYKTLRQACQSQVHPYTTWSPWYSDLKDEEAEAEWGWMLANSTEGWWTKMEKWTTALRVAKAVEAWVE